MTNAIASINLILGMLPGTDSKPCASVLSADKTEQCSECISDLSLSGSFEFDEEPTQASKRVRFDLQSVKLHENGRDLSSKEEWNRCWYDGKTMRKAEQDIFRQSKKLARPKPFLKRHVTRKSDWRAALSQFHHSCFSVKTESGVDTGVSEPNRKNMLGVYKDCTKNIVGLERAILRHARGGKRHGRSQAALILACAERQIHPTSSTQEKERIYQRVSTAISRPSRVFARSIAQVHDSLSKCE